MDLTGKLLMAMPGMRDQRFAQGVVLICAHSPEGAMGLIVNKPAPGLSLGKLLDQLHIAVTSDLPPVPIHIGGPVETGRGFVLHSDDYPGQEGTLDMPGGFAMTSTRDVLSDLASGTGPARALLALGYAGWGPGQIEAEILANGWLTGEATGQIVFDIPDSAKWEAALRGIGVDPISLSAAAGRA